MSSTFNAKYSPAPDQDEAYAARLGRLMMVYLSSAILLTLVFVLLFHTPLLANSVLFYRGCGLLIVASLLAFGILYELHRSLGVGVDTLISGILVSASLNLSFFVLLPVTIDRSVSTFVLSYIGFQDKAKSKDDIDDYFVLQYVNNQDAIGRRLAEQIRSRNVAEDQGGYVLTAQGKRFLSFARVVSKLYGVRAIYLETNPHARLAIPPGLRAV